LNKPNSNHKIYPLIEKKETVMAGFFKKIGDGFKNLGKTITKTATDLSNKAKSEVQVVKQTADKTVKKVEQPFVTAGANIKSGFNQAGNKIVNFGKQVEQKVTQAEKTVVSGLNQAATSVKDFAGGVTQAPNSDDLQEKPPGDWGLIPYVLIGGAAVGLITATRLGLL
jgi:hypothetical protein